MPIPTRFNIQNVLGVPGPPGPTGATGSGIVPQYVVQLASYPAPSSRAVVVVDGYNAAGDGGGGTFVWKASDTRADDGGTIIAVTGIATGRWNRINPASDVFNALHYGCDPTGSTDCTAAIGRMVAAKEAAGGGTIYFPKGNYRCASTIDFGPTACVIKGDGWTQRDPFATLSNCTGSYLRSDLTSGSAFTIGVGVSAVIGLGVKVRDLAFVSNVALGGNGLPTNTTTGLQIRYLSTTHVTVENVYCAGFGVGFDAGETEEGVFKDLTCWYNTVGILCGNDNGFNNDVWHNINCQYNGTGILVAGCENQTFFGGIVQSNTYYGIHFVPPVLGGGNAQQDVVFDSTWIEGNDVTTAATGVASADAGASIQLTGVVSTSNLYVGYWVQCAFSAGSPSTAEGYITAIGAGTITIGIPYVVGYSSATATLFAYNSIVFDCANEDGSHYVYFDGHTFRNVHLDGTDLQFVRGATPNASTACRLIFDSCGPFGNVTLPTWSIYCVVVGCGMSTLLDLNTSTSNTFIGNAAGAGVGTLGGLSVPFAQFGNGPAQTGGVRLSNNQGIYGRYGSTDFLIAKVDNIGELVIGDANNGDLSLVGGTGFFVTIGVANRMVVSSTGVGFNGVAAAAQPARVGALTDNTTGAPSTTIGDVGSSFSQSGLNNIHASLLTKINALELVLHNNGLTA